MSQLYFFDAPDVVITPAVPAQGCGVFRDFVTLVASELDLVRIHTPESRARCRQITARYKTADTGRMHTLFSFMVNALSEAHQDFLGEVYMETRAGCR